MQSTAIKELAKVYIEKSDQAKAVIAKQKSSAATDKAAKSLTAKDVANMTIKELGAA